MTGKQENKLSMYLAVKAVCDRNNSTWQTLQAFVDGYADFGARVINIQNLAQSQAVDSTGLSADKEQLRKTMAAATVEVALATNAYAKKVKNNDLAAKTNVSASTYLEGRDMQRFCAERESSSICVRLFRQILSPPDSRFALTIRERYDFAMSAILKDEVK